MRRLFPEIKNGIRVRETSVLPVRGREIALRDKPATGTEGKDEREKERGRAGEKEGLQRRKIGQVTQKVIKGRLLSSKTISGAYKYDVFIVCQSRIFRLYESAPSLPPHYSPS